MKPTLHRGFTLLELLMVLVIIGILLAMLAPALSGFLSAQRLSTTASTLASEFGEARQLAQSLNRSVEMRFYRYTDSNTPGSTNAYRARQILIYEADGTNRPHGRVVPFETGIILAGNANFTTLLKNGESSPGPGDLPLPRCGTTYQYFGILFQPGGGIRLGQGPTDRWCFTLVDEKYYQNPAELPANFITLQLDPYNGRVRLLQP